MAQQVDTAPRRVRTVSVDLVVALLIFVIGAVVAEESYRLGSSWGSDGPEAGYFPFYVGLLICLSGAVVFVQSLVRSKTERGVFVSGPQFRQVLVILLPSIGYVLGVQLIGIYVSSALFILLFMKIAGRYSWLRSAVVGGIVSVSAFVLFEIWFKIPLPKGPLERALGF